MTLYVISEYMDLEADLLLKISDLADALGYIDNAWVVSDSYIYHDSAVHSLQIVILDRLILNLIQGADQREDEEFRTRTGLEPPAFATGSFLGNIGGPLRTLSNNMFDVSFEYGDAESIRSDSDTTSAPPDVDVSEAAATIIGDAGFGREKAEGSV